MDDPLRTARYWLENDQLACGHEDDDPYASHKDERGEPVCRDCCPECERGDVQLFLNKWAQLHKR